MDGLIELIGDAMFLPQIIDIIKSVSPALGTALGGPLGGIVGSLISSKLGIIDMNNTTQVSDALLKPDSQSKLKELELQLTDLQNARLQANKDEGWQKLVRPLLALFAMIAVFGDVVLIEYVTNSLVQQILVMMLVILVWDIRQIYKFYFGSSDDLPNFPFIKKK